MAVSLKESQCIDELASILYDMLPGSGNPRLSFPTVAQSFGLLPYWPGGSKRPAIVILLTATFERERHRFTPLIEGIVRQSISWRAGKGTPLTRDEVDAINQLLLRLRQLVSDIHGATCKPPLGQKPQILEQTGLTEDDVQDALYELRTL